MECSVVILSWKGRNKGSRWVSSSLYYGQVFKARGVLGINIRTIKPLVFLGLGGGVCGVFVFSKDSRKGTTSMGTALPSVDAGNKGKERKRCIIRVSHPG